jgi:hypothetical protein
MTSQRGRITDDDGGRSGARQAADEVGLPAVGRIDEAAATFVRIGLGNDGIRSVAVPVPLSWKPRTSGGIGSDAGAVAIGGAMWVRGSIRMRFLSQPLIVPFRHRICHKNRHKIDVS